MTEISNEIIPAAGAVLWRLEPDESILIAIIHRPRYDDWSLPKGKVDEGESDIAAAFREVREETGITSVFGPELGQSQYQVEEVTKVVRYWSAQATDASLGPVDPLEVDQIEWLTPIAARAKLTSDSDRSILDSLWRFGPGTVPLILFRHAKAVKRGEWDGDDGDRPLDNFGQVQAKRLPQELFPYHLTEIHSSDAIRCIQSVEPLARSLSLQIIISADLSEYRHATKPKAALEYAQDLMDSGEPAIICSHNPILPQLLKKLIGKKSFKELDRKLEPGEAWVLHHRDGDVIAIDWMPAPIV